MAYCLLAFGILSSIASTHAILGAVKEENTVVQLAQQLVAHEAVVQESTRAQKQAQDAVAAVSVVQAAASQLASARQGTNETMATLHKAAWELNHVAQAPSIAPQHLWEIGALIKGHSQYVAEGKALQHVADLLEGAHMGMSETRSRVASIVSM
ncbi:hypothetical protein DUNSADRAFT_12201, partial [Dunaliella salina]